MNTEEGRADDQGAKCICQPEIRARNGLPITVLFMVGLAHFNSFSDFPLQTLKSQYSRAQEKAIEK